MGKTILAIILLGHNKEMNNPRRLAPLWSSHIVLLPPIENPCSGGTYLSSFCLMPSLARAAEAQSRWATTHRSGLAHQITPRDPEKDALLPQKSLLGKIFAACYSLCPNHIGLSKPFSAWVLVLVLIPGGYELLSGHSAYISKGEPAQIMCVSPRRTTEA